jgi:hypothetical protein
LVNDASRAARINCSTAGAMSNAVVIGCWTKYHADLEATRADYYGRVAATIRQVFPAAGYLNEGDWFEKDWQHVFWGVNYARLLAIKHEVDPHGLFVCHHCVGSEGWTADGNCRL